MGDPYEKWKSQVYSWLLCWKSSDTIYSKINRDIAILIARLVPVDFTRTCCFANFAGEQLFIQIVGHDWRTPKVKVAWSISGKLGSASPCHTCLRPCKRMDLGNGHSWPCDWYHPKTYNDCVKCLTGAGFGLCTSCFILTCRRLHVIHELVCLKSDRV